MYWCRGRPHIHRESHDSFINMFECRSDSSSSSSSEAAGKRGENTAGMSSFENEELDW